MFVINGVPAAIVEHKNPTDADAIERGLTQLRRYELETPELLGAAQLFNVTHVLDYWYGVTWNISRRYMARWKESPEESYRFAVQSFFEPTDFLRTLRDWILFYVEDGETRKSVLAPAPTPGSRSASSNAAPSLQSSAVSFGTHRESGKTFTLLTAARLILEAQGRVPDANGGSRRGPHGAGRASLQVGSNGCSARCSNRTSPSGAPTPGLSCGSY